MTSLKFILCHLAWAYNCKAQKKNNYSSKSKNSTSKMGVKNETLVYQAAAEHFHKKNSGSSIVSPQVKYKILKTVNLSRI